MSKYTTQLRWPLEGAIRGHYGDALPEGWTVTNEADWHWGYQALGLDDYPIFDEAYRDTLNHQIIRHYFYSEIGQETLGQFRMFMRDKLFTIMPYYNKLYEALAKANPFDEIDMRYTTDATNTAKTSTETENSTKDTLNDTPMNMLTAGDQSLIDQGAYASQVTIGKGKANTTGNGTSTVDQDGTEKGRRHSIAYLTREYAPELMNIDQRIVEELHELFFLIW